MERPTLSDMKADAKRNFRWRYFLPNTLWIPAFYQAISRLHNPAVTGNARLFWGLMPIPFLALAIWSWHAINRASGELERAISQESTSLAFIWTVFWLFGLVLLDAAVGLPLRIPGPFGLPDESLGWPEAAFVPILLWVVAGIITTHRRLTHK